MNNPKMPPDFFLRLFRWYCHPKLVDHIEGDLLEEYQLRLKQSGKQTADFRFVLDVILLFRPGIIKSYTSSNINSFTMYKSYFIIGWRTMLRNSGHSLINIGGLAIGMTVAILNGLWIWDEISFNTYHKNYPRIAQVAETGADENGPFLYTTMTYPLTTELADKYSDKFKNICRTSWVVNPFIAVGELKVNTNGLYTDPGFCKMFSLEMLEGTDQALKNSQSIILSSSLAKSLFGNDDPMNKIVRINNQMDATVTGVYADLPANTKFGEVKYFGSFDLFMKENPWIEARALTDWRNHFLQVYVEVPEENSFERVASSISHALKFDPADEAEAKKVGKTLTLYPMSRWHLHPYNRGQEDHQPMMMVRLVAAIGIFILLLACINFMNLSTARSEKRAKEVGIRKTIGSMRSQVVNQFFAESFLVVLFAFVFALTLASLCIPSFNTLANKQVSMPWADPLFWIVGIGFCVVTSLLAGSYPALYMSSFNPITALKGRLRAGRSASLPRKILVTAQFSISVVLIICTAVVYQQIQFAKNRPVGFNRNGLLMVPKRSADFYGKYNVLRAELKNTGVVEEVSESLGSVTEVVSGNNGWEWKGRDHNIDESFVTHSISHAWQNRWLGVYRRK